MRWLAALLLFFCAGCFRTPRAPELPYKPLSLMPQSGSNNLDTIAQFMSAIGMWGAILGAFGLLGSIAATVWLSKKAGSLVALTAISLIIGGGVLVFVAPYFKWMIIFGILAVLAAIVYVGYRNRKKIIDGIESATGLDIDGEDEKN